MRCSVHRRWSILTLCLAFALALSFQAMLGAAMAAPAHAAGMASSMPDGCKGCDDAKADSGCITAFCSGAIGVLAEAPKVEPQPRMSIVAAADCRTAGWAADPDTLPPRP